MGNSFVHFQVVRHQENETSYKWFKLRRSDVTIVQIENKIMNLFALDEEENMSWTLLFMDTTGKWDALDNDADVASMFSYHHGQGTKKSPISIMIKCIDTE